MTDATHAFMRPGTADGHDLDRLRAFIADALGIVGSAGLQKDETSCSLHSYDASLETGAPDLVVAPRDTGQLEALIDAAYQHGVKYVMRGAGTGYSGGSLPVLGGAVILTRHLDRILETNLEEGWIRCEPGVVLAKVQQVATASGWRYPPDPSSYENCTIGGNLAENAGGPHALGGGPTSTYVTAIEMIGPAGRVILDEQDIWDGGLDLRALAVGSEGTLGAIASATLRFVRASEVEKVLLVRYARQEDAVHTVMDVFQAGILPSALDMLTSGIVPGQADFRDDSLLFIGIQGLAEEVAEQANRLTRFAADHHGQADLLEVSQFLQQRAEFVRSKVRRMVAAAGRPRYYLFDAVAPRSRLIDLMDVIRSAAIEFDLPLLNTFHAGDGNVHPTPFYTPSDPDHRSRLLAFSTHVLRECRRLGGSLSGEHGIGLEKLALMPEFFSPDALRIMSGVRRVFDPAGLSNPSTMLPAADSRALATPPDAATPATPSVSGASRPRVYRLDALVEISDPSTTFAEIESALADEPYELPFEPLGKAPDTPVLAALDEGWPALRDTGPARIRDLIVSATLRSPRSSTTVEWGGLCVKDVAGYEIRKLVYGARGRLGKLTHVRLRLLPRTTDSRRIRSQAMSVDDAAALCRRVHVLGLPFCYLGILVTSAGTAHVTGRIEVRGGPADRHLNTLHTLDETSGWSDDNGPRWTDPVMTSLLAGSGPLSGVDGVAWQHTDRLHELALERRAGFSSIGHRRLWWRGEPTAAPPEARLADAVSHVFTEGTAHL